MMQLDPSALELARTHSYTLGLPRNTILSPDGAYLYFLRSPDGTSLFHDLWRIDLNTRTEKLLFDPSKKAADEQLTPEEEKQRERLRETSSGVTNYILSKDGLRLCFALSGKLWLLDTQSCKATVMKHVSGAFDPRFNPDGSQLSYVTAQGVWVIDSQADAKPRLLCENPSEHVSFGRAEFIASEEFERYRGHWWSADGRQLVVAKIDESDVCDAQPVSTDPFATDTFKYPAVGTNNAQISLSVMDLDLHTHTTISWDTEEFQYLLNVQWPKAGLHVTLQSRDQRTVTLSKVSPTGELVKVLEQTDPIWVDVVQPMPVVVDSGEIISVDNGRTRGLAWNGQRVTPKAHHVDGFLGHYKEWLLYTASPDPKERVVFAVHTTSRKLIQLSPEGGLFGALATENRIYVTGMIMGERERQHLIFEDPESEPQSLSIASKAESPKRWPAPTFFPVSDQNLQASILLPQGHDGSTKLPILIQLYGGPHHQEVIYSARSYLESQWWADQGYAVLSVDGPGTPGRDIAWEQAIYGDFITNVASAQIQALDAALAKYPFLDGSRVAARGWSFGGYLSAFLPMLYPDRVHASLSGAPVTDWHLYDTHYTERYLGHPETNPQAYATSSLVEAARTATRPILLIHGLQDDNVLFANSLKLVDALNEARCPYQFIPLSGASHFTKQTEQKAWLLQTELAFLQHYV